MKKKWLLLLIGVSVLVASGCSKKEAVTAEELLGNPYGAVVESGDFDITMKLTNADGEQTSSGNLQFDKDGVHFKSSDKEYYLIRSNSYVKEYDYVADTGRWTVKDEDSLDTSVLSNLGIITNAALSDWVITGDSTFDKAGHFGTCDKCLSGEAPLAVTITFDRDTKRLLKAEYVLKEEQPGGVKAYSLTVVCKSVNNIKVQLPDDVKNNAILEGGVSGSAQVGTPTQTVPDELMGTVAVDKNDTRLKDIVGAMAELGIEGTEYQGIYYITTQEYDKIAKLLSEREGLTTISETDESAETSMEETSEGETAESNKVGETDATKETDATSGVGDDEPSAMPKSDLLTQLEQKYPGLLSIDYDSEDGTSVSISIAESVATAPDVVLFYCSSWAYNSAEYNRAIAILVDSGYVSFDDCVASGADAAELTSLIESIKK